MDRPSPAPPRQAPSYWRASRTPLYGLLAGLPLLALYEGLTALLGTSFRNGAEVWLLNLFPFPGGVWAIKLLALLALLLLFFWRDRRTELRPAVFGFMLLESVAYSLLLSGAVGLVLNRLPLSFPGDAGLATRLTLSFGAGFYEELLFRVLLFGGLWALFGRWVRRLPAAGLAALISALVFALAHHLGPLGEPFEAARFAYRCVSGLLFTGLYVARGFGITALAHALYDVWVALGVL